METPAHGSVRVKLVTLQYSPSAGGFDPQPLDDFIRDKHLLAVREHFFTVHDLPHLACLVTFREVTKSPAHPPRTEPQTPSTTRRARRDELLATLDETQRARFETLPMAARWPKSARFTITQRLQNHALDLVEQLVIARFRPSDRRGRRDRVNLALERMRYLLRLAEASRTCAPRVLEKAVIRRTCPSRWRRSSRTSDMQAPSDHARPRLRRRGCATTQLPGAQRPAPSGCARAWLCARSEATGDWTHPCSQMVVKR